MQHNLLFSIFAILGLVQVTLLPGWLISHFLIKIIGHKLDERLIFSFIFSMIFNSLIIFPLTLFHTYTQNVLLIIISIELLLLFYIEKNTIYKIFNMNMFSVVDYLQMRLKFKFNQIKNYLFEEKSRTYQSLVVLLSILTITYLLYLLISNVGTLFNLSDAIFSWNRWATQWASNTLPTDTWEYPQLLPMNWSVFYVLLGQSGEFLAKAIMPLFPLFMATMLFSMGIKTRNSAFILSVFTIFILLRLMNGYEIMATEGYADTAVSFFSLVPLIFLYRLFTEKLSGNQEKITILAGALSVIAALLTKQTGIFIALIYPLAILVYLHRSESIKTKILKYTFIYISLILILVGPYYIYKEFTIYLGEETSVLPTINALIHAGGNSNAVIIFNALIYTIKKSYLIIILYFISTIYLLFKKRLSGLLFALPAIIITLYWSLFLSYDSRNLTFGVVLLGISLSFAIHAIINSEKTATFIDRMKLWPLFLLIALLIFISGPFLNSKILNKYNIEKKTISNKELSTNISSYFADNNDDKKIYSNFALLHFLPDTKDRLYELNPEHATTKDNFEKYFDVVSKTNNIGYILATNYSKDIIINDIKDKIKAGKYVKIFDIDGFILVKVIEKNK